MAAQKNEVSSADEILLTVPEDLALVPLGFSLDAGGSVTKVVYRSKEDYRNGKRIGNAESKEGLLRLRYFRSGADDELINFIRDHCDVMESASEADGWFQTGVQTQRFKEKLEEVIRTKVKTISEPDSIYKALKGFYSCLESCRPLGLSPESVDVALQTVRGFLQMMRTMREMGDDTFDLFKSDVDPQVTAAYAMKIMTTDAATLAAELSQYEIEWPCVNVTCGSANAMMMYTENGKFDIGCFTGVSGLTFLGLGKALCGAKDFDELIEMASRGDHRKVDTMSSDMKIKDQKDVDVYSLLPDNHVVFTMAKLAEDAHQGTYTKEDIAAGLLHMVASTMAKLSASTARLGKAKCAVFNGSFVSRQVSREALQEWLLLESLMQPFSGEEQTKWVFIPYPGFICALGAWYRNWELEQERRTK